MKKSEERGKREKEEKKKIKGIRSFNNTHCFGFFCIRKMFRM